MEHDIYIHHFGHYLAIFVEFTLAYGGWEAFKSSINKVSLRSTPFYENNKDIIEQIRAKVVVASGNPRVVRKAEKARGILDSMETNELEAQLIYNGIKFQSMFYLLGAFYITVLVLAGIQTPDMNKPIFAFIGITSAVLYMYQFKSLTTTLKEAKSGEWIRDKWRNSYVALEIYAISGVILFIALFFVFLFHKAPSWCQTHYNTGNYFFLMKNIIKGFVVFLMLGLPIPPFFCFYKRKSLYFRHYELRYNSYQSQLEELIEDIQSESKTHNLIVDLMKPKKSSDNSPKKKVEGES